MDIFEFRCGTYVEYDENIWFAAPQFNGLVCVNKKNGRIVKIVKMEWAMLTGKYMYSDILMYEGHKMLLVPNRCSAIGIYDIEQDKYLPIKIDEEVLTPRDVCSMGGFIYGEYLYILPSQMKAIVKMDIKSGKLKYISDGLHEIEKKERAFYFRGNYEIVGKKVYAPLVSSNGVVVLDLENDTIEITATQKISRCSTVNRIGNYLYFGGWEQPKVWKWNLETEEISETTIRFQHKNEKQFNGGYVEGNYLLLFPYSGTEEVVIDTSDMSYKLYEVPKNQNEKITTYCIDKSNGNIKFAGDNDIFKVTNASLGEVARYIEMDESYNRGEICKYLMDNGYFEVGYFKEQEGDLKTFLELVSWK